MCELMKEVLPAAEADYSYQLLSPYGRILISNVRPAAAGVCIIKAEGGEVV